MEAAATLAAAADTAQPLQIQARAALDAAIAQALHMLDLAGGARGSEVRPIPTSCQIRICYSGRTGEASVHFATILSSW